MWGGGRGSKILMISSFFFSFFFLLHFFSSSRVCFCSMMEWFGGNQICSITHYIFFDFKKTFFCLMLFFVFPYSELTQISLEGSIPFYHHITCVYISLAMDFYRGGNKLQKNIILQSPKNKKNMFFIQSKSTCLRS